MTQNTSTKEGKEKKSPLSQTYEGTTHIAFYLYPNFSMIAFSTAIEALRLANRMAMKDLYDWVIISTDGEKVKASNGVVIDVDQSAAETKIIPGKDTPYDYVFVCSGLGIERYKDPTAESWLRVQALQDSKIGALCTGAYVLANAGLLNGHQCVIHWENLASFQERFPDIDSSADLYEVDDNRLTCGGGTASLDLMLYIIREEHGRNLAWAVSEQCLVDRMRNPHDQQRLPIQTRLGIHNNKVITIIEAMEANIYEPLSMQELASRAGFSRRQMERIFAQHAGRSPAKFYLDLRLQRARHLLYQSDMSILDIAMSCGFVSASHFSKTYKEMYGKSPREERGQMEQET